MKEKFEEARETIADGTLLPTKLPARTSETVLIYVRVTGATELTDTAV